MFISYIVATADGHVGVTRGDPLGRAGARQVVVVDAVGVVAGDGGEGVQRQIPVLQTATHTHTHTHRAVHLVSVFIRRLPGNQRRIQEVIALSQ